MNEAIAGIIYIFYFDLRTGNYRRFSKKYSISPKGRLTFRYGAGLFEGLKRARLGQFEFNGDTCYMYSLNENYDKNKAHFLKCALLKSYRHLKQKT